MKKRNNMMVTGSRALTGFLITAVAATGAVLAGTVSLPTVERATHAVTVNTTQAGERSLVCAGPFTELGADPARPDVATPIGEANLLISGPGELTSLERNELDENSVSRVGVVTAPNDAAIAAAQTQQISTATIRGMVSSSCVEAVNEQWLVGGGSATGETTTLTVGNPGDVAATVQLTVFDENGEMDALQTAGVIVAPRSAQVVSLNGYAPASERIAVRVTSTGAPVSASIGVTKIDGITPMGAATVARQLRADTRLVIPGVTSEDQSNHDVPENNTEADRFPVRVQALAPGNAAGTAFIVGIDADGNRTDLGAIELEPKTLGELVVKQWPEKATAVIIEADVPVFGAVEATANAATRSGATRDFGWFTPAPEITPEVEVAVPIASGGTLIVANPGSSAASVTATSEKSGRKDSVVTVVPAGAAVPIEMGGSVGLTSDAPVYAAVQFSSSGSIASYPALPNSEYAGELTVFTR